MSKVFLLGANTGYDTNKQTVEKKSDYPDEQV
jgi:hypothetical protein